MYRMQLYVTPYSVQYVQYGKQKSVSGVNNMKSYLSTHITSDINVRTLKSHSVKTSTIPAWDQTLAGRVRDGMTLQGTYIYISCDMCA